MIYSKSNQIEESARQIGIYIERVSLEKSVEVRDEVERRFATLHEMSGEIRMCERLSDPYEVIHVLNDNAWNLKDFVDDDPVFLIFDAFENPKEKNACFLVNGGLSAIEILDRCSFFTYYIIGLKMEYLISYSEEQYVFASGKAMAWLKTNFN